MVFNLSYKCRWVWQQLHEETVIKTWSDKIVPNAISISNQHHSGSVKHKSLLSSSKLLLSGSFATVLNVLLMMSFIMWVLPGACLTVSGRTVLGSLPSRLPFVTQVGSCWFAYTALLLHVLYIHSNSSVLGSSLAKCLATNSLQGTVWNCFSFKKATNVLGPIYLWNQPPPCITPSHLQTLSGKIYAGCG